MVAAVVLLRPCLTNRTIFDSNTARSPPPKLGIVRFLARLTVVSRQHTLSTYIDLAVFAGQVSLFANLFRFFLTKMQSALETGTVEQVFISGNFQCHQEPLHPRERLLAQHLLELIL